MVTPPPLLHLGESQATTAVVSANNNPSAVDARAERLTQIDALKSESVSTMPRAIIAGAE